MKKSGPDRQYTAEFRRAAESQVIEGGQDCLATTKHIRKLEPRTARWSCNVNGDDSRAMNNRVSAMQES
jgi:hypothetical protein